MTETGETPSEQPKFSRRGFLEKAGKAAVVGGAFVAGRAVGALDTEALRGEPQINLAELPAALLQSFNKDQRGTGAEKGGIGEALKAASNVEITEIQYTVPLGKNLKITPETLAMKYNFKVGEWPLNNVRIVFARDEQVKGNGKFKPSAIEQSLGAERNQSVRFHSGDGRVWNVKHGLGEEGSNRLRADLEKGGFTVQADPENPQDWSLDVSKGNRVQRYHGVMPVGLFDNANNLSKIGIVGYNTGIQQYEHIPSASF